MNKQARNKRFLNIIILVISLIIVVLLSTYLLDTTGKINQGSFRVNDLVIFSTADVQDKKAEEVDIYGNVVDDATESTEDVIDTLSDLRLDVSQKNEISFLITKSEVVEPSEIYIDNININFPTLTENMYIYQTVENKVDLKSKNIKLTLNKEEKDEQYLIKFNIDNINCIKNAAIPDAEASITFDGTIFSILNTKISDISFKIEFNLNILDTTGKLNICPVKLNLPNELLITSGVSIIQEDARSFPFRIK